MELAIYRAQSLYYICHTAHRHSSWLVDWCAVAVRTIHDCSWPRFDLLTPRLTAFGFVWWHRKYTAFPHGIMCPFTNIPIQQLFEFIDDESTCIVLAPTIPVYAVLRAPFDSARTIYVYHRYAQNMYQHIPAVMVCGKTPLDEHTHSLGVWQDPHTFIYASLDMHRAHLSPVTLFVVERNVVKWVLCRGIDLLFK